jgi:hypothetical protein
MNVVFVTGSKQPLAKLPEPIRVSNNLRRFCDLSDDDLLNSLEAQLDAQFEYSLCRNQAVSGQLAMAIIFFIFEVHLY